jgi:hypothetical protein
VAVSVKPGVAGAVWTASDAWVLADCPSTVAVNVIIAVVAVAEDVAVNVNGSAAPGVADNVEGDIVTPVGSPDTVIVAAPAPAGAASRREACCPAAPAVRLMAEGVSVSEAWDPLLLLPLLLQEARPPASKLQAKSERMPLEIRLGRDIGWGIVAPGDGMGCHAGRS